jgi:hypothetical protein
MDAMKKLILVLGMAAALSGTATAVNWFTAVEDENGVPVARVDFDSCTVGQYSDGKRQQFVRCMFERHEELYGNVTYVWSETRTSSCKLGRGRVINRDLAGKVISYYDAPLVESVPIKERHTASGRASGSTGAIMFTELCDWAARTAT